MECEQRRCATSPAELLALVPLTGCTLGGLDTGPLLVRSPDGVRVEITLAQGVMAAELLEVRHEGLLVLVNLRSAVQPGPRVVLVDSLVLTGPILAARDPLSSQGGRRMSWSRDAHRDWLRRFSRFPWGMTPEVERRLLELHGQDAVRRVPGG